MCKLKKITDTVLIFGASTFLKEINLDKLLNLGYTTFGINVHDFKTDFVSFVDTCVAEKHESMSGTIITQSRHVVREPFIYFDNFSYDFTHDYLLRWLHGRCTSAILVGTADFIDDKHYNSDLKFIYCESCKKRSIKFIEGIKDIKIFKMNEKGILNVPIWKVEN